MRRHDVVSVLMSHCINVMCLLGLKKLAVVVGRLSASDIEGTCDSKDTDTVLSAFVYIGTQHKEERPAGFPLT